MTEVKREVIDFRGKQKGLGPVFLRQDAKEKQVYQAGNCELTWNIHGCEASP